jgi:hypothetical protein
MSLGRTRLLAGAQAAQAILMLYRPERLVRPIAGRSGAVPPGIVRVLGGRLLVQSIALGLRPSRSMLRVGATVDLLHAASMVGLAIGTARYRRPALFSGLIAAGSAVAMLSQDHRR